MADSSKIAQRLLAHARLCRQIAEVSWSEDVAVQLGRLADDCTRAAGAVAAVNPAAHRQGPLIPPHAASSGG